MVDRSIIIDGMKVELNFKQEKPRTMMLTESVAFFDTPEARKIEVVRAAMHPFIFEVRGENTIAQINISDLLEKIAKVVHEHDAHAGKKETTSNYMITVQQLGSGWSSVCMCDVTDKTGTHQDVWQTGIGRYKTRAEAVEEAINWSVSDVIALDPKLKAV